MHDSIARSRINSATKVLEGHSGLHPLGGTWKRAFDIAMAALALLALMPLMLATAVLVRLLTEDYVILCEHLFGRGGWPLSGYKSRIPTNTDNSYWAERVAEALQDSGLDRLPQLFNVIWGDMSLVGPRPRGAAEFGTYFAEAPECLLARPGLITLRPNLNPPFGERRTE